MRFQRQLPAVVSSPRLKQGLGSSSCLVLVLILEAGWEGRVEVAPLSSQDKGGDGLKELDSLKSDRLRTIQLNICKSEEVEEVVEIVRSSLEDPEKGAGPNAEDTEMAKTQTLSLRTSQFIKGLTQMISTYPLKEQHRTEVHSPGLGWGREWNS